jgi:hypothetical protein
MDNRASSDEGWRSDESEGAVPGSRLRSRSPRRGAVSPAGAAEDRGDCLSDAEGDEDGHFAVAAALSGRPEPKMPESHSGTRWWHEPLWMSMLHKRLNLQDQCRPISLVSGCSGIFVERTMCDMLDIKISHAVGCDIKRAAQRYVADNVVGVDHFLTNIDELIDGVGKCTLHNAECQVGIDGRPDIAMFSPPCQPFTKQRGKSGKTLKSGPVGKHPTFYITMKKVPVYCQKHKPLVAIVEQVEGFLLMTDTGEEHAVTFTRDFGKSNSAVASLMDIVGLNFAKVACTGSVRDAAQCSAVASAMLDLGRRSKISSALSVEADGSDVRR